MTRRRYVVFGVLAVALATLTSIAGLLALDLYLHHKYMDLVALNVWGYRGPSVGRKQPGEWRLAVLGESTAFGFGVRWDEAAPAYLQNLLTASAPNASGPITVLNLAYNNEGAHSFKYTLRDYEYLEYDAVLFYSGYNDLLGGINTMVFRHSSPIFRLTGYFPLFPLIFHEKAMALRYGGDLEAAYRGQKTTFRPTVAQRATATAIETAVAINQSIQAQLARQAGLSDAQSDAATSEGAPCGEQWAHYCGEMYEAIKIALERGRRVLMVTQPYIHPTHPEQQRRLREYLQQKFGDEPRLTFADLGHAVDLKDPALCWDGMHLTPAGNRRLADALVPHVRPIYAANPQAP